MSINCNIVYLMDIIIVFNGLGNQMSQYAFYLAKKRFNSNCYVVFDPKSVSTHNGLELENIFEIKLNSSFFDKVISCFYGYILNRRIINRVFNIIGVRIIYESKNYDYQNSILKSSPKGVNFYWGGWHSEKYFKSIEQEIKNTFKFPSVCDSPIFNEWLRKISFDDNSVSIHVRRGDYLDKPSDPFYQFNGVCTIDYYKKAIAYIQTKIVSPNFYIFSNDVDWCMQTFGIESMYYIDCNKGKDSWRDMYLMSECRHHINANSTFSWWAAWLSPYLDGIVLRPKFFIKDIETKDFYPAEWTVIE